jgi:Amt family ammonium transporter
VATVFFKWINFTISGLIVYGILKAVLGLRMSQEDEFDGADLSIHKITSSPDRESSW